MWQLEREQQAWVIQPLLDAGLDVGEIHALLVRLTFHDIVAAGRGAGAGVHQLVLDRPVEVRAAWLETIDRMIRARPPARGRPASPDHEDVAERS